MKVGITGTREGWTPEQHMAFAEMAAHGCIDEFHHGDCMGVDEQSAKLISKVYGEGFLHCHPPSMDVHRAFVASGTTYPAKPYLVRNTDIVNAVGVLIVIPKDTTPRHRSGTWHTYRKAVNTGTRRCIIWPNGRVTSEG